MKAHCFVADSVEDIESDILKALNSGLSPL